MNYSLETAIFTAVTLRNFHFISFAIYIIQPSTTIHCCSVHKEKATHDLSLFNQSEVFL